MSAGRMIKVVRMADGIQQEELARDLEVSRTYLSQVENGRAPSLTFLRAVAKRLNIPLPLLMVEDLQGDSRVNQELRRLAEDLVKARVSLLSLSGGSKDKDA